MKHKLGRATSAEKRVSDWTAFRHSVAHFRPQTWSEELVDLQAQRNRQLRLLARWGVDALLELPLMPKYLTVTVSLVQYSLR